MKTRDINYIKRRLKLLKETAKELKKEFKKSKVPILEDLYLEINCYSDEINSRIRKIEKEVKRNGNR